MHSSKFRPIFIAIIAFALLSVVALWSFNTLSELFSWPQAQYKHAIAAIALLFIAKWALTSPQGRPEIEKGTSLGSPILRRHHQ